MGDKGKRRVGTNRKKPTSDRLGGPSTARGLNFQTNYAIYKTLHLVATAMNAPHKRCWIALEPRYAATAVTAWDIQSSPPDVIAEAKLAPTHSDLTGYLERVKDSGFPGAFLLVWAKGSRLLTDIEVLTRLANEARGDSQRFNRLVEAQHIGAAAEILSTLGPNHQALLQRISVENLPEEALRRDTDFCAKMLTGAAGPDLAAKLFKKFSEASERRQHFEINDIINELKKGGLQFHVPAEVALAEVPVDLPKSLYLLQRCPDALPIQVLARAVETNLEDLAGLLEPLESSRLTCRDGDLVRVAHLPNQITVQNSGDLVAKALPPLLEFIRSNGDSPPSRGQLRNAIALGKAATSARPDSVIDIFLQTQSLLKSLGDKHLVLEVADLCLEAANRMGADERAAKTRALTLICGKSWVYQRVERLAEALTLARKSLDLGQAIPWPRNTAYCKKCIGRIMRLQAEAEPDPKIKKTRLAESVEWLKAAIEMFEQPELGLPQTDTGDSYSLLGRTYLVAGQLDIADASIQKAFDIILAGTSKDYMDLKILAGDMEARRGNLGSAESHYSDVLALSIPDDHERSEILARARLQRGILLERVGRIEAAKTDYRIAQRMWSELDERTSAAKAEWRLLRMTSSIPQDHIALFEAEKCPRTRVRAFLAYQDGVQSRTGAIAYRSRPSQTQVANLLTQARRAVALEPEW